jgi:hypothetical protein
MTILSRLKFLDFCCASVQSQEPVSQLNSPGKMVCQSINHPVFYGRSDHSQRCDDVKEGLFFFTSNNETATSRVSSLGMLPLLLYVPSDTV